MKNKSLYLKIGAVVIAALVLIAAPIVLCTSMKVKATGINVISVGNARAAMLLDYNTGTIIYEHNKSAKQPIASMVKIMTLLLAFEKADAGLLDYESEITVSETASGMGGSQAFLDAGSSYKVNDLLQSIVVASANDSCVAIAEAVSGSVDTFVSEMNEKAKALGMENTYFVNCTGLPAEGQYSCAADVAIMSRELFSHEKFFEYSGVWMYDLTHPCGRTTRLTNTNKLIKAYEGCDGGKTGFTNEAMSCLAATAKRGNTRLISIVIGAPGSKERNAEICKLFNYGFSNYDTVELLKKGDSIEEQVSVDNGKEKFVTGVYADSFHVFGEKGNNAEYSVKNDLFGVKAPVRVGDIIGKATVCRGEEEIASVDILAASDVDKTGYMDIVDDFISNW